MANKLQKVNHGAGNAYTKYHITVPLEIVKMMNMSAGELYQWKAITQSGSTKLLLQKQ